MIGQTVSHYRILEKLGEGGMGVVYKAEDTKLKRIVALKFLPKGVGSQELERERFHHEAEAASALNHPDICAIHSLGEYEGQEFIDMEYVNGPTLSEKIRSSPLSIKDAVRFSIQIAEALQEAHAHGIVHRDIKPQNILITDKNEIKVTDFGLAKLKGSLRLTKTSSTVGTLAYMSPEQIQGQETDARSDIFSLGIVMFEMLTGHLPFRGEHEAAIMYSIVNEAPELLSRYLDDAPPSLQKVILKALRKSPAERYQTCVELLDDLRQGDITRISSVSTVRKPRKQAMARSVVLLALLIAALVFKPWEWIRNFDRSPRPEIRMNSTFIGDIISDPADTPAVRSEVFRPPYRLFPIPDSVLAVINPKMRSRVITRFFPDTIVSSSDASKQLARKGKLSLPPGKDVQFYAKELKCGYAVWFRFYRIDPPYEGSSYVLLLDGYRYKRQSDSDVTSSGWGGAIFPINNIDEVPEIAAKMAQSVIQQDKTVDITYRILSIAGSNLTIGFDPSSRPRTGQLLQVRRTILTSDEAYRAWLLRIQRAIDFCSSHPGWKHQLPQLQRDREEVDSTYNAWKVLHFITSYSSQPGIEVRVTDVFDSTALGVVSEKKYPWLDFVEGDVLTF